MRNMNKERKMRINRLSFISSLFVFSSLFLIKNNKVIRRKKIKRVFVIPPEKKEKISQMNWKTPNPMIAFIICLSNLEKFFGS